MIKRDLYIRQLEDLSNTKTVKILTGLHGCGKSYILLSFVEELNGKNENVIYLNLESLKNNELKDYLKLYDYISDNIKENMINYIVLDNISKVDKWYDAVNSITVDFHNVDFYISGLNNNEALENKMNWPVIKINVLPLSFKEYLQFDSEYWNTDSSLDDKFKDYLHFGGLPVIFEHKKSNLIFTNLIEGLFSTVFMKELILNNSVKNPLLLKEIYNFAVKNLGEYLSSKRITESFKTEGVKTTAGTVIDYLKYFDNAYIFYSVKRYNLKCDAYLRTLEKQYISDLGLRNLIIGFNDEKSQGVLENLIYFELLRRSYRVSIVKYNSHKIDFQGQRPDKKIYIQAIKTLNDEKILDEKINALKAVKDNHDKYIISFDKTYMNNIDGIKVINIIDFLLKDDEF